MFRGRRGRLPYGVGLRSSVFRRLTALLVGDLFRAGLTTPDDGLLFYIRGGYDIQLIVLHALGFKFGGNFGLQFLTWLQRKCRSNSERKTQCRDDGFHFRVSLTKQYLKS